MELEYKGSVYNVNLSCYDLAPIVNGFPCNKIELYPFDFVFQRDKIFTTWVKVGFLPLTRNSINNLRVCFELGEGRAWIETRHKIELLVDDYENATKTLDCFGFNGDCLDIGIPTVYVPDEGIMDDEEKVIEVIIRRKGMNKSGNLFKLGIHKSNYKVVLGASRRMRAIEENTQREKEINNKYRESKAEKSAVIAFKTLKKATTKYDKNGHPKMPDDHYKHILKVIIPRIIPDEGIYYHTKSGK